MQDSEFERVVVQLRSAGCVFAEDEARLLLAETGRPLDELVRRRAAGEPLEVVLGWAEFCGLRVQIDPGVFVPRRRTEFLVDLALESAAQGQVVVDLCCGSGAVGLAVVTASPGVELYASDIDPVATRCAARNLAGAGSVTTGDLMQTLPDRLRGRVNLLLVNAPYVPTEAITLMPSEARDHEPRHTLDGGPDGVDIHRRVAGEAASWPRTGGGLLIETSDEQAELTAAAMTTGGLQPRIRTSDELGATVVVGTRT